MKPKTRALKPGMEGEDVLALQDKLRELGYYTAEVTGSFDKATEKAVKDFQDKHLPKGRGKKKASRTTGIVNRSTAESINREHKRLLEPRLSDKLNHNSTHLPQTGLNHLLPPTLKQVSDSLRLKIPRRGLETLEKRGIRTLDDIRKKGGYRYLKGFGLGIKDTLLKRLDAHSNLALLSKDIVLNEALIEKGYASTIDIANATRTEILAAIPSKINKIKGVNLHIAARTQKKVLTNLITGIKAKTANGFKNPDGDKPESGSINELENSAKDVMDSKDKDDIPDDLIAPRCECRDCESAVSPLAYLADLLDYAVKHIKHNDNTAIDLDYLVTHFKQPFADLPVDCAAMDAQVRQMRINIEVLRKYFNETMPSSAGHDLQVLAGDYRFETYRRLLLKLGTSYEELRLLRTWEPEEREAVTLRLGIPAVAFNDLQDLLLDPGASQSAPAAITEKRLEILFGLVDTTRNELSDGPIVAASSDIENQILRWNLSGVEWNRNTDALGKIYVRVQAIPDGYGVSLYRDSSRTQLVAEGVSEIPQATIELHERNSSNLTGVIAIEYGLGGEMMLSVIPEFLSWRLIHQRGLWRASDWSSDAYSDVEIPIIAPNGPTDFSIEPELPFIDPDLIGPDDFRNPFDGDPAFALWKVRRIWVDSQLSAFEQEHVQNGVDAALSLMSQQFTYQGSSFRAWPQGLDTDLLDTHLENLKSGEDIDSTRTFVEETLRLTGDTFLRLMELRQKDLEAVTNPDAQAVTGEEWQEFYAVLVQARKKACYTKWINEEMNNPQIEFGPKDFVISISEPKQGQWPPRQSRPYIDPDSVALSDLPDSVAGRRAIELWHERKAGLAEIKEETITYREQEGYDKLLERTFGQTIQTLKTTYGELFDANEQTVRDAENRVTQDYRLSVDDFKFLMSIQEQNTQSDPARKPTKEDWVDVHEIITQQIKVTQQYTTWIQEEEDNATGVDYHAALKAKLPPWRATQQARSNWKAALERRSEPPIIDPDQISSAAIRDPYSGTVSDIWYDRRQWVNSTLTELENIVDAETSKLNGFDRILVLSLYGSSPIQMNKEYIRQFREATSLEVMIKRIFGRPVPELRGLYNNLVTNTSLDETKKTVQLSLYLAIDLFSRLMEIDEKVEGGQLVSSSEWDEVDAILTQRTLVEDVMALEKARSGGNNIRPRLKQLSLTDAAFSYLVKIRQVLANDISILDTEWTSVRSILCQVTKRRKFATWRRSEQLEGLCLCPDYFKPEDMTLLSSWIPEWRANFSESRQWNDLLQARIEQDQSLREAFCNAVDEAEGETLPLLANLLITSMGYYHPDAKDLSDRFGMDMEVSSCAKTTRISQAITTIQTIIWSVRTGQISGLNLKLEAENFDEEWKWLGSYATWRAAMFTFMYPENLLLPTLRRWQTAGFRELVAELRRTSRLTRDDACALANQYSSYFRDVANIGIETTCEAKTQLRDVECGSDVNKEGIERKLFYMFGYSYATRTGYWSSYDEGSTSGYGQTFWEPIPGLNQNVSEIVGAVPYDASGGKRYICLLSIITHEHEQSLVLNRYGLNNRRWLEELEEEDPEPLDLPEGSLVGAILAQSYHGTPAVLIRVYTEKPGIKRYDHYIRYLNAEGDDWSSEEDFAPLKERSQGLLGPWTSDPYAIYCLDSSRILVLYSAGTSIEASVFALTRTEDGPVWETPRGQHTVVHDDSGTGHGYNRAWMASFPKGDNGAVVLWRHGPENKKRVRKLTVSSVDSTITLMPSTDFDWSVDLVRTYYLDTDKEFVRIAYKSLNEIPGGPTVAGMLMTGTTETFHGLIDLNNPDQAPSDKLFATLPSEFQDHDPVLFRVHDHISQEQVDLQRELFEYLRFLDVPASFFTYLHEAYYYVRIQLASQLQRNREYLAALDWYRTVYDYGAPYGSRERYRGFEYEASTSSFERLEDWLLDPLNPHLIAATRADANLRFTLMSIIRCLLEFADSEYTQDTVESVSRAVNLYETALDLLDLDVLKQQLGQCAELIGQLNIDIGDPAYEILFSGLRSELSSIAHPEKLESLINNISKTFQSRRNTRKPIREKFAKAFALISDTRSTTSPSMGEVMGKANDGVKSLQVALLRNPKIADVTTRVGERIAAEFGRQVISLYAKKNRRKLAGLSAEGIDSAEKSTNKLIDFTFLVDPVISENLNDSYVPNPNFVFCIPPNPIIKALRLHAELNLYKIRNCRNIAGMERELEPYAAPTDTISGLPAFGEGAQISIPGDITIFPTPYRYAFLIERAKQFIQVTQQVENAFLSALEKRDAEAYTLLKARQDRQLARAGVRLQDLRVRVAEGEVKLAELQKDRADIQAETYRQWIDEGLIGYEHAMIVAYITAGTARILAAEFEAAYRGAATQTEAATGSFGAGVAAAWAGIAAGLAIATSIARGTAIAAETTAQVMSVYANFERRKQEWELQEILAEQDSRIAIQQTKIAENNLRVVGQERNIAEMQADFADDTVQFLANKFTNADLYDWMSRVLEEVYSFFLEQATSVALLAANQLAFERQQILPAIIKSDYWEAPSEEGFVTEGEGPDRRGLTGSARLLKDIYELDQYALETSKRKLQLTKTFSLSRLAPGEFQRFRETGVMRFDTPMILFDRDFPGHYLRLIKRVRTSIIALIPATQGIKATLTTSGLSRVLVGGMVFQTINVRRPPESVALTSPQNATGLFELEPQAEMLYPFEGMGVDTSWELRLPKASNQFNFQTIADVLITIEYTALDSFDYRQQVLSQLDGYFSGDLPISLRYTFPDGWYHLHNPTQENASLSISFTTRRNNFPPNIDDVSIKELLLYFSMKDSSFINQARINLTFKENGGPASIGGEAIPIDGSIYTLKGNAGGWEAIKNKAPFGDWELTLPNTPEIRQLLQDNQIDDILFVITYSGHTPEWPQ